MHSELDIGTAGFDSDFTNDFDRRIPHRLILAVGQRLCRRNRDGVAGMHAHGIDIFNRADDDDVVGQITHHLQLVFLPTKHRLFNQAFMNRRKIETARKYFHQLFAIVGKTAAGTAQRE